MKDDYCMCHYCTDKRLEEATISDGLDTRDAFMFLAGGFTALFLMILVVSVAG